MFKRIMLLAILCAAAAGAFARMYDPKAGRFVTRDTIGTWGDSNNQGNAYTYVGNNPWTRTDPYGLESDDATFEPWELHRPTDAAGAPIQGVVGYQSSGGSMLPSYMRRGVGSNYPSMTPIPRIPPVSAAGKAPASMRNSMGTGVVATPAPALASSKCTAAGPKVEQYALVARKPGFYPVMERGHSVPQAGIWLNPGDVWKYGQTMHPATRYSQTFLRQWNLRYQTQFIGTRQQALSAEQQQLLRYVTNFGDLPPGNKIMK